MALIMFCALIFCMKDFYGDFLHQRRIGVWSMNDVKKEDKCVVIFMNFSAFPPLVLLWNLMAKTRNLKINLDKKN